MNGRGRDGVMAQVRHRRRKRRRFLSRILWLGVAMAGFGLAICMAVKAYKPIFGGLRNRLGIEGDQNKIDLDELYSPYAVLVDASTGEVLAEKNMRDRIYPASMTKIMTALLAVENTENMDETVVIPEEIFPQLYAQDASMAGFSPGETATLKDLLYGMLLPSGAECCLTFADRIAGSESAFAERMNQRAGELGMERTHFCNSTGLHDDDHYSTVEDISILLRAALKEPVFRKAFTSERYLTSPSELHPDGITFYSTLFQYMDSARVEGGEILGGKTGYTDEAGQCLASLAQIDEREYVLVTAGAEGTHDTAQYHIQDAIHVYGQIGKGAG